MDQPSEKSARKGAVAIGALVSAVIDPVTRRRGFATSDLIAAWPEIIGARWADCTLPEKIVWPRDENGGPAVLAIKVDGPKAVLVQHEAGQIIERVNAFLGYGAVGKLRITQAPVSAAKSPKNQENPVLSATEESGLVKQVSEVDKEPLRTALERLGRGVIAERNR